MDLVRHPNVKTGDASVNVHQPSALSFRHRRAYRTICAVAGNLIRGTAALEKCDRLLWVLDFGPSFISIADVRRNVCCPQTHQSQIGRGCVKTL
jgi:hypothetical protein